MKQVAELEARIRILEKAVIQLSAALSRIDYALGEPNEMQVSEYDIDYDEERVVRRVRALIEGK